jgi:hypothetical protein
MIFYYIFQERLDFSCAMFGPDGGLVANAPHIPVHLGSMQETVQYQVIFRQKIIFYGFLSNVLLRKNCLALIK